MKVCANCSEIKDRIAVKQEISVAGEPVTREPEVDGLNNFLELSYDDSDCPPLDEQESGVDDDDFEWDIIKQGWVHQSSLCQIYA